MLARFAGCCPTGRAVGARFEIDVAEPSFASPRKQCGLLVLGKISDCFSCLGVRDYGAGGHSQQHILGTFPVALRTAPALAIPSAMNAREAILDEGIDVSVGDRIDAAAAAAVAAVRSAARY